MNGRDPMKGRHNVGGRTGSAGKIRGGQPEPASNKVKTGTNTQTSKKKPLVPNAADTSANAQTMIQEAPAPFKNKMTAAQMPVGTGARGAVPGQEPKNIYAGKSGSAVGQSNPGGAAVGYSKLPNQGNQIGGRMGFPPPARKAGSQNLSKVKRNASFYGESR